MNTVQPIRTPTTLTQAVVAQLREAIVAGTLAPGLYVKEGELSKQLGLSVTPLREALVQLASEGLIEVTANKRKRVAPIDYQAMVELLEVQNKLWELGYSWGALKVGPTELARLQGAYQQHASAIADQDRAAAIVAAHRFHRIMMEATGNRELVRVSIDRQSLVRRFILLCAPEMVSSKALGRHKRMLKALKARDLEQVTKIHHQASEGLIAVAKKLRDSQAKTANNNS